MTRIPFPHALRRAAHLGGSSFPILPSVVGQISLIAALIWLSKPSIRAENAYENLTPEATLRSFDRYNSPGLTQSTVTAFAQDNEGVLWVGTHDGLARFDGTEITGVSPPSNQPSFGYVIDLIRRRRGGVFVGGSAGVYMFDGKSWFLGGLGKSVASLVEDRQDRLWAVDQHGEVWRETDVPGGQWDRVAMPDGFGPAVKVASSGENGVWVASSRALTRILGDRSERFPVLPESAANITALCADDSGGCWIGTQAGAVWSLNQAPGASWSCIREKQAAGAQVMTLTLDRRHRLWCGDSAGTVAFGSQSGEWNVWGPASGLNSVAGVVAIFADREGTVWIGENAHGAQQFFSESWTHRTRWDGASGQRTAVVIGGLAPTLDGGLLAGVFGFGLWRWDGGHLTQYGASQGLPGPIRCAAEPAKGVIWAAGRGGIFESRLGGPFQSVFNMPLGVVNGLCSGPDHAWYALTTTNGILENSKDGWTPVATFNNRLPDLNVKSMIWRANGDIWVGTMRGLTLFRDGTATTQSKVENDCIPTPVHCMLEIGPDELWVGGTGGIGVLSSGRWHALAWNEEPPGRTIYALARGADGTVWAAGGAGVGRRKDGRWTLFNSHNGLLNDECNLNGIVIESDGSVCVATMGGLARFDPNVAEIPAPKLNCYWRSRPEPGADGTSRLERGVRSVALSWIAPWLRPTPVEYRTRVSKLSNAWSKPSGSHELKFANIGPGEWTVEVQARLEGSGEEDWTPPLITSFTVPPLFMETPWAPMLGVLGAAALAIAIVNVRTRHLRRRQRELQLAVAEAQSSVKTLRGMIPICASCKSIRDDHGAWNRLEAYVQEHSLAEFSHGMCPACARKFFPDIPLGDGK